MDIILHIGTEKTGTSTIQSVLNLSQDWLRDNGFFVPNSLRPNETGDNQILLPALFCDGLEKSNIRIKAGQLELESDREFDERVTFKLEKELSRYVGTHVDKMVISSEHLSSRLRTVEELKRLANWLERFGKVTKIVVYLRRQDEYLISSYSTDLKSGRSRPFNIPGPKWAKHRYDYRHLLQLWGEAFGFEKLVVRPFEVKRLLNESLIDDFSHQIGLPEKPPIETEDKNLSLDVKGMAVLLEFNAWIAKARCENAEAIRQKLVSLLGCASDGNKMHLSRDDIAEFMGRYDEGNTWVAENFLGKDQVLFKDPVESNVESTLPPKVELDDVFLILAKALSKEDSAIELAGHKFELESENKLRSSLFSKLIGYFTRLSLNRR